MKRHARQRAVLALAFVQGVAALALVAGCGGDDPPGLADTGAPDTGSASDSAVPDTGAADTGTTPAPCPPTDPAMGGACATNGLICAYGSDPRPSCRAIATCTAGAWVIAPNTCPPTPMAMCPATRTDAAGMSCTPTGAYCDYGGLACLCTDCDPSAPVAMCSGPGTETWHCTAPHPNPNCPTAIPNQGTVCAMDGQRCGYGCETDMERTCTGGVWVASTAPGGCPVSMRRAKRDIAYLSTAQTASLSEQLLETRLATYEYIDPALAGTRRLGFIIEDQPMSYAINPEASQVDLYGYTSMLVAAVQTQQRQLETMGRQIRDMRRQLRALRGRP